MHHHDTPRGRFAYGKTPIPPSEIPLLEALADRIWSHTGEGVTFATLKDNRGHPWFEERYTAAMTAAYEVREMVYRQDQEQGIFRVTRQVLQDHGLRPPR